MITIFITVALVLGVVRAQVTDTTAPTVTITAPSSGSNSPEITSITGTAADTGGSGLDRVEVFLVRTPPTAEYWTGTTWTSTATPLPNSTELGWSRNTNLPTGTQLRPGNYEIRARAYDNAGNQSVQATRAFSIYDANDTAPPTVALTFPPAGGNIASLPYIQGTASDASGIAKVDVFLYRIISGQTQMWNGTAWGTTWVALPNSDDISWYRNSGLPSGANLPAGTYRILVTATDAAFRTGSQNYVFNLGSSNDNFVNALTLAGLSASAPANNATATKETNEPDHGGNTGGKSLWYRWVAPETGVVSVASTVVPGNPGYQTLIGVYTGTALNALTPIASTTAYTLTFNATAGTLYQIAADGFNGASGIQTLTVRYVTQAVVPLASVVPGDKQVTLNWTSTPSPDGYLVYRLLDVPRFTYQDDPIASLDGSATSFTDTNLRNGQLYFYALRARSNTSLSKFSEPKSAIPSAFSQPPANVRVSSAAPAGGNITPVVQWDAVAGATGYRIYRRTASTEFASVVDVAAGVTSWTDSARPATQVYYYAVSTLGAAGAESALSSDVSISGTAPSIPTNVKAVMSGSGNGIFVQWRPVEGATHYTISQCTLEVINGVNTLYVHNTFGGITKPYLFHASPATNSSNQPVVYVITAHNAAGSSTYALSNYVLLNGTLYKPTDLRASATVSAVNLNWTSSGVDATYQVLRSTRSGGPYTQVATGVTATSFTDNEAALNVPNFYVVRGVNNAGSTPYSNEASASPLGWQLKVNFSELTSNSVTLRLPSLPPGKTGFTILRARQTGGVPAAPTTGLMAWYRSDAITGIDSGSGFTGLMDLSGSGRHAASPAPANNPLYIANAGAGRPAMRFDGMSSLLRLGGSFDNFTQGLSIFTALKPDKSSAPGAHFIDFASAFDGGFAHQHVFLGTDPANDSFGYGVRTSTVSEDYVTANNILSRQNWQVMGVVQQAGTGTSAVSAYRNGVEYATGTLAVPENVARTSNGLGNWYTGTRGYKADIGEVLVYNRAVTAGERANIEAYLSRRYGVMPATTPTLVWEPLAYNQPGEGSYQDSGLNPATTYWYKVVANGTPDMMGDAGLVTTLPASAGVPSVPAFTSVGNSSVTVTPSPNVWPANTNYFKLQYRKAAGTDAQYRDYTLIRRVDATPDGTNVQGLESDTLYRFRYVALGEGTVTEGPTADVRTSSQTAGTAGGLLGTYYGKYIVNTVNGAEVSYELFKPVFTRVDPTVSFNWDVLSPRRDIPNDYFGVRWSGYIQPKYTENYTLYLHRYNSTEGAESHATMWIDGVQKLITPGSASTTIQLNANQKYAIQIDFREDVGQASIFLKWQSDSQPLEIVPADRLYTPQGTGTGLRAQYFNDRYYSQQLFSRTDNQVAFGWPNDTISPSMSKRDFAVMWTGKVMPLYGTAGSPENYTFTVDFNGGAQLYVNNTLVINKWVANVDNSQWLFPTSASGTIALQAGVQYNIKLLYRADAHSIDSWTAPPKAVLKWSSAKQAPESIPTHRLFPATSDSVAPTGLPELDYAGELVSSTKNIDPYPNQAQGNISVTFRNIGIKKWLPPTAPASEVVNEPFDSRGKVRFKYWYFNEITHEWADAGNEQFLDPTVLPNGTWTKSITWPNFTQPGTKQVACQLVLWMPGHNEVDITPVYTFSFEILDEISGLKPVVVGTTADMVRLRLPRLPEGATSFTLQRATGGSATLATAIPSTGREVWMRGDNVFTEEGAPVQVWKNSVGTTKATALAPDGLTLTDPDKKLFDPRPTWTAYGPGGRPAIRFDGKDDCMSSDIVRSGTGYSSFAVARSGTARDYRGMFMFWTNTSNVINYGTVNAPGDYSVPRFRVSNDPTNSLDIKLQPNRWNVGEAFWQANTSDGMSVWRDGQSQGTANTNNSMLPASPFWIGGYDDGVTRLNFKGEIAEVLVYNRVLNATERQTVEKYLADKYALSYLTPPTTWTNVETNLAGNILYEDTGRSANTEYWYRLVANYPSSTQTGGPVMATTRSVVAAPSPPGAIVSGVPTNTTMLATLPGTLGSPPPVTTDYLKLQIKLPAQPDTEYADVPGYYGMGEEVLVSNLQPQTTYSFRTMAVGPGGQTPGGVRNYTTLPNLPEKPDVPEINNVGRTGLKLTMPPLPLGATSLRLEYRLLPEDPFVTAVNTNPGSTNLDGGVALDVNGLMPERIYYFRAVAVNVMGETPGDAATTATSGLPPAAPGEPRFQRVGSTSLEVIAPAYTATSMKLQGRSATTPEEWWEIVTGLEGGAITPVNGLSPGETYSFRYVAYSDAGSTPGVEADITLVRPLYVWRAGSGIECRGFRNPGATDTFVRNQQIKMRSFLATDWDARDTHDAAGTKTDRYTDACTYTWTCPAACVTAGGGFLVNGVKVATYTGPNPTFVVPNNTTAYTVTLAVDDQGGLNIDNGDLGTRGDAALFQNLRVSLR